VRIGDEGPWSVTTASGGESDEPVTRRQYIDRTVEDAFDDALTAQCAQVRDQSGVAGYGAQLSGCTQRSHCTLLALTVPMGRDGFPSTFAHWYTI
jgi:hypothetical protein